MANKRVIAYLALTTTSLVWAVGAVLIKYSLYYTTPVTFLFWRFLIVAWVLFPFLLNSLKKDNLKLKDLTKPALLGFMATTATLGLLFLGMSLTSAVEGIIINSLAPIFIIAGGAIFLREQITKTEKIGAILAFAGSMVAVVQPLLDNNHSQIVSLKGNILILLSVVVWAAYSLLVRRDEAGKKYSALSLTGISFIVGLFTIIPFFLAEKLSSGNLFYVDPRALTGIIYMAIAGSCIGYLTYNLGLGLIEASEATIFTYLQPVFSIPLAMIWLKESVNPLIILGAIFIVAGVILTEYKPTKKKSFEKVSQPALAQR